MPKICSAKREGKLKFSVSPINFVKFKLEFMGSGTSVFTDNLDFQKMEKGKQYKMIWVANTFIGKHWLLGNFKFTLNKEKESFGILDNSKIIDKRQVANNKNNFYFDFDFPKLFNLKMTNNKPIINSSIVFDIPPTNESTFRLENENLKTSFDSSNYRKLDLSFNFCEVTAYPEQNIDLNVLKIERIEKNKYKIKLKYKNILDRKADICFFTVIHDDELTISNDYGFQKVKPNDSFENTVIVTYMGKKEKVIIPFFAGLYKPVNLRGAKSQEVELKF